MANLYPIRATQAKHEERGFALLLRGGGHGAYAAAVVDELLAHGLDVEAIGAAGGGVANAVAIAYGLALGGRESAQRSLRALWRYVGARSRPEPRSADDNRAALGAALGWLIDFDRLGRDGIVPLFIAAMNVQTGALRLFAGREITLDVVLAAMSPEADTREVDGRHFCAAGVHEEFAALPLLGSHGGSSIVAPFMSPLRARHADRLTIEELDAAKLRLFENEAAADESAGPLGVTKAWALGQLAARSWLATQAYRPYRQRMRLARAPVMRRAA